MRYVSTRGRSPAIGFRDAVLSGLAPDGGLYMPARWPQIPLREQTGFRELSFANVAATVLSSFAGEEIPWSDLLALAKRAFAPFDDSAVAPLVELGDDDFLLELFHGPTLAFKDIAMRMLAELYGWALGDCGKRKTIIGATSGDTGAAAIHAFGGSPSAELFILYPKDRISAVQRRMMTTTEADNVCNIEIDGSFDQCQAIVKALLADATLNRALDLGGVNSINWVRLAVQTVYYFTAAARFDEPVSFVVPTGNFGDAFAAYAAKRMGAPVRRIAVAVNSNDIMCNVLENGIYKPAAPTPTSSPSMDIQTASNFERLLFEALDRDGEMVIEMMAKLESAGTMKLPDDVLAVIKADFSAERASEMEVSAQIRFLHSRSGILVDPHTAVGLVALRKLRTSNEISGSAICLATAHPAKFPETVVAAAGVLPATPERLAGLMSRKEKAITAPANAAFVREIILQSSRLH